LLGSLLCNQGIKRFVDRFNGNSKIQILAFDPLESGDTYNQSVLVQNGDPLEPGEIGAVICMSE